MRRIDTLTERPRALSIPVIAVGALATGALAIAAVAIARLAIGQMVVNKAKFRSVEIDDLTAPAARDRRRSHAGRRGGGGRP